MSLVWFLSYFLLAVQSPDLSLDDAVRIAESRHAGIAAAAARVESREGLLYQARLRPNPAINFQTENWRFYGDPSLDIGDELDAFAFMEFPLERGEKRNRRVELSQLEVGLADLERVQLSWEIRQAVRKAFHRAVGSESRVGLAADNLVVANRWVEYHRRRLEEGALAEVDLLRVEIESVRLGLEVDQARRVAADARLELQSAMGVEELDASRRLVPPPQSRASQGGMGWVELRRTAMEQAFDVRRAQADLALARARLAYEIARSAPDWSLVAGYKRTGGYHTLLGGVSVPLRLFDGNQGNVMANRSEVSRAEHALVQVQRQVLLDVRRQVRTLGRLAGLVRDIEGRLLAVAEQSYDIAAAAYQEDAMDLLRLLDAQRTRNDVLGMLLQARLEFELGWIELEHRVGQEGMSLGEETFRSEQDSDR